MVTPSGVFSNMGNSPKKTRYEINGAYYSQKKITSNSMGDGPWLPSSHVWWHLWVIGLVVRENPHKKTWFLFVWPLKIWWCPAILPTNPMIQWSVDNGAGWIPAHSNPERPRSENGQSFSGDGLPRVQLLPLQDMASVAFFGWPILVRLNDRFGGALR